MGKTQYEKPRPALKLAEVDEKVAELQGHGDRLLLLAEGRPAEVLRRTRQGLERSGRSYVEIDGSGLDLRAFTNQLAEQTLAALGQSWQRQDTAFINLMMEFQSALSHSNLHWHREKNLLLLVSGVAPEVAVAFFARCRDELWAIPLQIFVVAPAADKDSYLLTYSDSYFMQRIYRVNG